MNKQITTVLLTFGLAAFPAAQEPVDVGRMAVSAPTRVGEIDPDRMKGQPSRLAWSPDGSELYLQMMEGEFGKPPASLSHYVIHVSEKSRKEVGGEPEWVSAYWTAKSGQAAPDSPAFKIELKSEVRIEKAVAAPMGGDLARGGGSGAASPGATTDQAVAAAYNQQRVPVHTMLLHGEIVGEYINSVIVPGQTFGWGPAGSRVIAYAAHKSGRLVIMDDRGTKREIDGTRDVLLPAWSLDGTRLAWLEKDGRKKYVIRTASLR